MTARRLVVTALGAVGLASAAALALASTGDDLGPMTLYVDGTSSTGRCSDDRAAAEVGPASPWCSLAPAVERARGGSRVLVRGGSYPRLRARHRARRGPLTFIATGTPRPVLAGATLAGGSHIRIEGFRITDVTVLEAASHVKLVNNDISPHGIAGTGTRLVIAGNDFHDLTIARDRSYRGPRCNPYSPDAGVPPRCGFALRLSRVSGVAIRDNSFRRIPADGLQALDLRNTVIEGNLFEDISAFVDPLEHSDSIQMLGHSDRVTIRRNFFHRARGVLAQPFKGRGAQRRLVIENNVMVRLRHWGVNLFDAPGARIVSNTIWDTGGRGIGLSDYVADPTPMRGAVVVNNVVSSIRAARRTMAREDYNLIDEGTRAGSHDLPVPRPRFVNRRASDYRLARRNPAIDAGNGVFAPRTDIRGASRVDVRRRGRRGSRADIGAYEFAGRGARRSRFRGIERIGPARRRAPGRVSGRR